VRWQPAGWPRRDSFPSLFSRPSFRKVGRGKKKPSPPARRRQPAKGAPASRRSGKAALRASHSGNPGREVDDQPPLLPVGELCAALDAEKIRFLIVGGTAAVLHGVPMATVDVDIWVDLPERQYVRILGIAQRIGAEILSNNVIVLQGDQRVDFLYRIDGLASFATEWKGASRMSWARQAIRVLPLARIIRSKEASNRPKDQIQLPALREYRACLAAEESKKRKDWRK